MLTAENHQPRTEADAAARSTPVLGGFAKVLNSVQGLQQRLNDFSFDEVSAIETNANTLIQSLSQLQMKLEHLAALKDALSRARAKIEQIPATDYNMIGPDSLVKHPRLHAIVNAAKLIRLQKVLKLAKENADKVILDPLARTQGRASDSVPQNSSVSRTVRIQPPDPLPVVTAAPITTAITKFGTDPVPAASADQLFENEAIEDGLPVESDDHSNQVIPAEEQDSELPLAASPAQNLAPAAAPTAPEQDDSVAMPIQGASAAQAATAPGPNQISGATAASGGEKRPPANPNEDHFDQRLLDELIQNYGEFVISANPANSADKSFRPEPNFVAPLPPPVAETALPEAAAPRAPAVSRHGEIDLQLKKIIKDYGEKDLYSHRRPTTVTKGGIAALIVLALVLAGFYFFRTPAKPTRTVEPPSSKSATSADSAAQAPSAAANRAASQQGDVRRDNQNDTGEPGEKTSRSETVQTEQKNKN